MSGWKRLAGIGLVLCLTGEIAGQGLPGAAAKPVPDTPGAQGDTTSGDTTGVLPELPPDIAPKPQPAAPRITALSVATWSIPKAPGSAPKPRAGGQPLQRWRNTFGAERRSADWRTLGPAGFDADVILLQGIGRVRGRARRLFTARTHLFIVTRQILSAPQRPGGHTAIAVRRRPGLRIVSKRHLIWRGDKRFAPPSVTAIRLSANGRKFWVVSVAVDTGCNGTAQAGAQQSAGASHGKTQASCKPRMAGGSRLANWLDALRADGGPVVIGSSGKAIELISEQIGRPSGPSAAGPCGPREPGLMVLHPKSRRLPQPLLVSGVRRPKSRKCAMVTRLKLN